MFKKAQWIWYQKSGVPNSFGEFYGEFQSGNRGCLKISCDGDYTLFINGRYVSSGQYGDFEHYKSVDIIDLTGFLNTGSNKIGILVWHFGKDSQRYKRYAPGVICEITDEETVLFATGEDTLCRQSCGYITGFQREISCQLGFSYAYDATKDDLWQLGNGRNMKNAYPVDKKCAFVPRPNKKLLQKPLVAAKKIGDNLYDLGKEYVGLLSFVLESEDGVAINIAYGECLESNHVKRKIGARDFSIDYTAKSGENKYTNYMLRFACRYLELSSDAEFKVVKIGIIPLYYPTVQKENTLNGIDREIYDISLNTLRLSMMEHYVDCPWREQCLYAFDSRNQMLCGYYAFEDGNFEYAKSNLLLINEDRRDDGLLSICYPCGINLTIPSFSLHYIIAIKEYIEHSGDTSIIDSVGAKLKMILKTFLANIKNGIVCTFENDCHWNFFDWSPYADGYVDKSEKGKADLSTSLLTVLALMAYEKICELCTLPFEFSKITESLRINIKNNFFSCKDGIFLNRGHATEFVNALAVKAEIVTGEEAQKICCLLASHSLISCSLSMKCQVYDALIKIDRNEYKGFILEDIRQAYSPMIDTGTVWETVVGASDFDNAGSLCHGWSSMPIYYYNIL